MPQQQPKMLELFSLDSEAAKPPFQQVYDIVIEAVDTGAVTPGTRLPTVRALAAHLGIAANTVVSAYRQLEVAGVIEGRGRAGTFVRLDAGANPVEAEARRVASETARAFRGLGVTPERARRLLDEAFSAVSGSEGTGISLGS